MGHLAMIDYPELPVSLTIEEHDLLQQCEQIIRDGIDTFYSVANALATVSRRKLYRETYGTFEAYCREQWNMGKAQAYRLIDADEVRENLSPLGDDVPLPQKESHIRALKAAPADKQSEVWQDVVQSGKPVTAKLIQQEVKKTTQDIQEDEDAIKTDYPEIFEEQPKPDAVTLLYHIGKWGVYVPTDIEIGKYDELYVHSSYGERFLVKSTEGERSELIKKRQRNPYNDYRLDWVCGGCGSFFKSGEAYVYNDGRERCRQCAEQTVPPESFRYPRPAHLPEWLELDLTYEYEGKPVTLCEFRADGWDNLVLVRDKETGKQERIHYSELSQFGIDNGSCQEDTLNHHELQQDDLDQIAHLANYDMQMVFEEYDESCDVMITPGMVECVMTALKRFGEVKMQNHDRDKLMRAGIKLYRADEYTKTLKAFTRSGGCCPNVEKPWGSWKNVEHFKTKKALKERQKELEREENVIIDGRI